MFFENGTWIQKGKFKSVICAYHEYQKVWEPQLNEEPTCSLEPTNGFDRNVVAELKVDEIIGNIPQVKHYLFREGELLNAD